MKLGNVRRYRNGVLIEHTVDGVPQPISGSRYGVVSSQPEIQGAGTELKKLLTRFNLKPPIGCKCNQRVIEMNLKGVEWCEQNIDTITGWLKEEATRAKLPFVEFGARIIIKRAIINTKRKQSTLKVVAVDLNNSKTQRRIICQRTDKQM